MICQMGNHYSDRLLIQSISRNCTDAFSYQDSLGITIHLPLDITFVIDPIGSLKDPSNPMVHNSNSESEFQRISNRCN